MQVFADDGACIDVRVNGQKHDPALVLIHGFPFTNDLWESHARALAHSCYVITPDLRGAGSSSAPNGPYLMERLAADVAASLDALGVERATLIGHSMGGYVALAFARMYTERINALALVASRLRADSLEEAAARHELADRVEREGSARPAIDAYLSRLFAPQTTQERKDVVERAYAIARKNGPRGIAATLRGMALRAPSEDIAEDLESPVLVLYGAQDRVVGTEESRAVAAAFPRARLAICDRSGHLPMLEEPDRVTEVLESFLSG